MVDHHRRRPPFSGRGERESGAEISQSQQLWGHRSGAGAMYVCRVGVGVVSLILFIGGQGKRRNVCWLCYVDGHLHLVPFLGSIVSPTKCWPLSFPFISGCFLGEYPSFGLIL